MPPIVQRKPILNFLSIKGKKCFMLTIIYKEFGKKRETLPKTNTVFS